jgi:hypothetical protein
VNSLGQRITHDGNDASAFIRQYFEDKEKRVLIVAGAGFDPRSAVITEAITAVTKQVRGVYIREERPNPDKELVARAEANVARLRELVPANSVHSVNIFDPQDGAVVGAKRLIRDLKPTLFRDELPTDIVLDLSALSIGISFPLVRFVYEAHGRAKTAVNIHLLVAEDAALDSRIETEHTDQPMYVPGFAGDAPLDQLSQSTRLWVPQLVQGRREALRRIHDFVDADETCPILPFPSKNLRRGDELLEHFVSEIVDAWDVDPRNYIYAAEREPLDLYRSLVRLDDARTKVYAAHEVEYSPLAHCWQHWKGIFPWPI